MENTHNFFIPKHNLIGMGAIKDLPNELLGWKLSKALIVTDKNMISLGYVTFIENMLKNLFISYDIFDGVRHTNPTVSFVEDALAYFPQGLELRRSYKLIISIGGGSNHDCAKAVAAVATNGGSIIDYEGYNKITKPGLPLIAVNTTTSAAEVTMFSIITDETRKVKMSIASPNIIPLVAVNDPMLMMSMPKDLTAAVGIDALVHALESYISTESSPITESLSLAAIRLVFTYLRRACENGNDMEAREQMMYAGIMGGMAFNNAGLGYVHAMSHQLGGFYGQIHGNYDAILLPSVLDFNFVSTPEDRILKIAEAIGKRVADKEEAREIVLAAIKELCLDIGIPADLKRMGVDENDLDTLAQNAFKDIATLTNPRQGTVDDIKNIYKAALQ